MKKRKEPPIPIPVPEPPAVPTIGCISLRDNHSGWRCMHCGGAFHISLLSEALRRVAEEAYRLGALTKKEAVDQAIMKAF